MSRMRVVVLGLAVGAAALAGIVAKGFLGGQQAAEVVEINKVPTVDVLVAAKDVQMGEKLLDGTTTWKAWPKDALAENMITRDAKPTAQDDFKKSRARITIFTGETLNMKKIVAPGDTGFMSSILPKGMRAISVAISEATSAGGFILPNDRVDVILTRKLDNPPASEKLVVSEIVLANVRVLAINQTFQQVQEAEDSKATVAEGKTATLELDPKQSEIIAMVESAGEISLALRSIAEADGKKMEDQKPELAGQFAGKKPGQRRNSNETLFVRYGVEKYTTNR
jgi:pilus assembly protein CpaB